MSGRLNDRSDEFLADVLRGAATGLVEVGLRAEAGSKRQLYKGHGVITGTLRRSIHLAEPGYDWASDAGTSEVGSPERGGARPEVRVEQARVRIELGSGMEYALAVHQGHGSFEGYHYLRNGLDGVRPDAERIIRQHIEAALGGRR